MAAPCSANGAHSKVGKLLVEPSFVRFVKSRNFTASSSSAIVCGVAQSGSFAEGPSKPTARLVKCRASAAATSPTEAAANAGHRNNRLGLGSPAGSYIVQYHPTITNAH